MKFKGKKTLLVFCFLLLFSIIKAQENNNSSISVPMEDDFECGLVSSPLIQINVSVWSNKGGYLKNLTYKDFEVYDEKVLQVAEFFKFDELKNQFTIGFYPTIFTLSDNKWRNVKIRVKLSTEKRKKYGKIFVSGQNGYYPNRN